jgi:hypothetical protein
VVGLPRDRLLTSYVPRSLDIDAFE